MENDTSVANVTEQFDAQGELDRINNVELVMHLPAIVYTSFLMLIGTPGNVLVLYVYFFKWRKSTSRVFILFLTGLDFINCVTTLPMEIFMMNFSKTLDIPWLCKVSRFSTYTMNSSSAALLVVIAVDRFKRICRPHNSQFSARTSKHICITCIVFTLLLTWPAIIIYGTRTVHLGKVEGKMCQIENKFDTSAIPYIFFIVLMASTVVIFTTLSVLYYFVGLQIYKHRKMRMERKAKLAAKIQLEPPSVPKDEKEETLLQDSDSSEIKKNIKAKTLEVQAENQPLEMKQLQVEVNNELTSTCLVNGNSRNDVSVTSDDTSKSERRTHKKDKSKKSLRDSFKKLNAANCLNMKLRIGRSTLMLFLITIAYIISFLPFYTIAIIRQTYKDFVHQLSTPGLMAYYVFLRSYLLSSAINPIIYSFCNAQFRTFCLDVFRRKSERRGVI